MDNTLLHLINEQWTNPVLDLFMAALSDSAIWQPFFILIVLAVLVFGKFRARTFLITLLLSLMVTELCTNTLKIAFDRSRPKQVERVRMVELAKVKPAFLKFFHPTTIRYSDESDRHRSGPSFPSGHATNNTVIAMCLTIFYPRRGWLYWVVTAAVCYSRVYLGAHWPSDIVATFFLASGETLLLIGIFELIWRRLGARWLPKLYARHPRLIDRPVS